MKKTLLFLITLSSIFLLTGCIQQPVKPITQPIIPPPPPIAQQTREVSLYYHNISEDKKMFEWISFNEEFFLPVLRTVDVSETFITDTFKLLFSTELTEAEKAAGFSRSVFDTYDFTIQNIILSDGILTIKFVDDSFLMSLASAEQGILTTSLTKTALQFPEIQQVILHEAMIIDIK